MKATRALGAVAFLVSSAFAATPQAALAKHPPRIVVEPVLSYLDDGRANILVSIANGSSAPIVVDPGSIGAFARFVEPAHRKRRVSFSPMLRYPCEIVVSNGMGPVTITSVDGTTMIFSSPEPWPSPHPTPLETPLVVDPGAKVTSGPLVFGQLECTGATNGRAQAWDVYAVITWHGPSFPKSSRIVSRVVRVEVPVRRHIP